MRITHSGNGVGASTPIDGQVFAQIMIRATADAVIKIGGKTVNIDTDDLWVTIPSAGNKFQIVSGTVNYIVFG